MRPAADPHQGEHEQDDEQPRRGVLDADEADQLLAPRPGQETRDQLKEKAQEVTERLKSTAADVGGRVRESAGDVASKVREKMEKDDILNRLGRDG